MQTKLIGILGGVGPMSGVNLQTKIINLTNPVPNDQSHLSIIHYCCPSYVPDRTDWINNKKNNPSNGMFELVKSMSMAALSLNKSIVVGIPCNTFHADSIFDSFMMKVNSWNKQHNYLDGYPGHIKILNMIELTLYYIKFELKLTKIGLLCTNGSKKSLIYDNIAHSLDLEVIHVNHTRQLAVHDSIYNPIDGLKTLSKSCERVVDCLTDQIKYLVENKAQVIILGCTELSIAITQSQLFGVDIIEPMNILAQNLIDESFTVNKEQSVVRDLFSDFVLNSKLLPYVDELLQALLVLTNSYMQLNFKIKKIIINTPHKIKFIYHFNKMINTHKLIWNIENVFEIYEIELDDLSL